MTSPVSIVGEAERSNETLALAIRGSKTSGVGRSPRGELIVPVAGADHELILGGSVVTRAPPPLRASRVGRYAL